MDRIAVFHGILFAVEQNSGVICAGSAVDDSIVSGRFHGSIDSLFQPLAEVALNIGSVLCKISLFKLCEQDTVDDQRNQKCPGIDPLTDFIDGVGGQADHRKPEAVDTVDVDIDQKTKQESSDEVDQ